MILEPEVPQWERYGAWLKNKKEAKRMSMNKYSRLWHLRHPEYKVKGTTFLPVSPGEKDDMLIELHKRVTDLEDQLNELLDLMEVERQPEEGGDEPPKKV